MDSTPPTVWNIYGGSNISVKILGVKVLLLWVALRYFRAHPGDGP